MFTRFDENPAMTLRRTDNVKTVYPLQTKFAGGIINASLQKLLIGKQKRNNEDDGATASYYLYVSTTLRRGHKNGFNCFFAKGINNT